MIMYNKIMKPLIVRIPSILLYVIRLKTKYEIFSEIILGCLVFKLQQTFWEEIFVSQDICELQ